MNQAKGISIVLIFVAIVCSVSVDSVKAKMVYAITDHINSTLKTYEIKGNQLEYQADVEVSDFDSGAVDTTIISQLEQLFITYEGDPNIVWANPKSLRQEGVIDLGSYNASQFAGIVADEC